MLYVPDNVKSFLNETGELARFTLRFFREGFSPRFEWDEFVRQCYVIGYQSLPLVALTAFIIGLVLTMQLRPTMVYYGVEVQIPAMVGISIVREIGPILTALIFAGKIGSSIGAELGSMKVTEQIDAMEVSGTNPFKYLVVTRALATMLMLPVLVILADTVSLFGAFLGVNMYETLTYPLFFKKVFDNLTYIDIVPAFIKTFFFGFAVGIIGCYKGYYCDKGTEGVGISANSSVVASSVAIFILDLIAVQISDLFQP
jgi:phospholipid/cholesterol/gamma-HCH transport system permease protein